MEDRNDKITLNDYLQIRNEAKVATLLFIAYTIIFFAASFFLVSQGARVRSFVSVGLTSYLVIGMGIFIPPFHKKAYLELGQPELKTYSSKVVPISSAFIQKQLIAYGIGLLVLFFLGMQALSTVPKKTEIIDFSTISSTTEESQTVIELDGNDISEKE